MKKDDSFTNLHYEKSDFSLLFMTLLYYYNLCLKHSTRFCLIKITSKCLDREIKFRKKIQSGQKNVGRDEVDEKFA